MLTPLWDVDNPVCRVQRPYANYALIGLNAAIFIVFQSGLIPSSTMPPKLVAALAVTPANLSGEALSIAVSNHGLTLFTYMFLHGSWLHLGGNMLFLWTFGDNVEDAVGHWRYVLLYLLCGASGALVHVLVFSQSTKPLIGASGAIAGLVMAYLMLHPRVRIWCLVFKRAVVKVEARFALTAWVLMQLVFAVFMANQPIAWWAHLGGILAGAILIVFLRSPGVPLFDKGLLGPGRETSTDAVSDPSRSATGS